MIEAYVIVDSVKWKKKINKIEKYFKKKLRFLSKKSFFQKKNHTFSLLLTNNKKMKFLNNKFRGKNKTTDVLSFPLNENKRNNYIGDIAVNYEIINRRSKETNFYFELDRMWVHGYLHLIGYDHKKNKDFFNMTTKEKRILNYLDYKY